MRFGGRSAGLIAAAAIVSGCRNATPTSSVCLPDSIAAVDVTVVSAKSGIGPDAAILAIASRNDYRDSSRVAAGARSGPVHVYLAFDEVGSFRVDVLAQGYVPWARDSIVVSEDACRQPITASVMAELVPSSSY